MCRGLGACSDRLWFLPRRFTCDKVQSFDHYQHITKIKITLGSRTFQEHFQSLAHNKYFPSSKEQGEYERPTMLKSGAERRQREALRWAHK
jgi:hypothetical protein